MIADILLIVFFLVVVFAIYWFTAKTESKFPHLDRHIKEMNYERMLKREAELAAEFQRKTKMVDVSYKPSTALTYTKDKK